MANNEYWIRFEKGDPEKIGYFFIPEIRKENNRKRVYGRIIYTLNPKFPQPGRCFRMNSKWAKQVTRKLEIHEVIKYKLMGFLPNDS